MIGPINMIGEDEQRSEHTEHTLNGEEKRYGLTMNFYKTKQWYLTKRIYQKDSRRRNAVRKC